MSVEMLRVRACSSLACEAVLVLAMFVLPSVSSGQIPEPMPGEGATADVLGRKEMRPLSLREAVRMGLRNNLDVAVAYNNLKTAPHPFLTQLQDAILEIHRAYYTLALRIEELKLTREAMSRVETLMANNETRVRSGAMAPIELTVATAEQAGLKSAVLTAEENVRLAERDLKRLTDPGCLLIKGDTAVVPADAPKPDRPTIDESYCVEKALSARADLAEMKAKLKERGIEVKWKKGDFGPEMDLAASFLANGLGKPALAEDDPLMKGPVYDPQQGLRLTVPLDGELSEKARALRELKRIEVQIVEDVRNGVLVAGTNARKLELKHTDRDIRQQRLESSERMLQVGRMTSFEVVTGQQELTQAQLAEVRALVDCVLSLASLRRQMGGFLEEIGGQAKEPAFAR